LPESARRHCLDVFQSWLLARFKDQTFRGDPHYARRNDPPSNRPAPTARSSPRTSRFGVRKAAGAKLNGWRYAYYAAASAA
jgi:hypothetical protein